jgi:YegS/Rv2252/BmrU family lipid kinase
MSGSASPSADVEVRASTGGRLSMLDTRTLDPRPVLVINPRAGQKLGLSTNAAGIQAVEQALAAVGVRVDTRLTQRPKHATELARQAVEAGCKLVIAAGGDGTVSETGHGLAGTEAVLGIMPMGSIMNTARTLCIPRDLAGAAEVIAAGRVLRMDVGCVRAGPPGAIRQANYLEAGGVGLAAGLFGYFDRLDSGASPRGVLRAVLRFLRRLGTPRLIVEADGRRFQVRSAMVTVANGPYVGAAYALAPDAHVDDGLLDTVLYREAGVLRVLFHMAMVAGGRRRPTPPDAQAFRVRTLRVYTRRRRHPLPVHADGIAVGATPAEFTVLPGALRVLVGEPPPGSACAWQSRLPQAVAQDEGQQQAQNGQHPDDARGDA